MVRKFRLQKLIHIEIFKNCFQYVSENVQIGSCSELKKKNCKKKKKQKELKQGPKMNRS